MSIKEKDLQTVNAIEDGDKIRMVTSGGGSRNIGYGDLLNNIEDGIEGAGNKVEFIKLCEVRGGGTEIGTGLYGFNGGNVVDGNKSIGDVIEGKSLIGFRVSNVDDVSKCVLANVRIADATDWVDDNQVLSQAKALSVAAVYFKGSNDSEISKLAVYAICI